MFGIFEVVFVFYACNRNPIFFKIYLKGVKSYVVLDARNSICEKNTSYFCLFIPNGKLCVFRESNTEPSATYLKSCDDNIDAVLLTRLSTWKQKNELHMFFCYSKPTIYLP